MTVTKDIPAVQKFCKIWHESFLAVLGQLGASNLKASLTDPSFCPAPTKEDMDKSVCGAFSGGGILKGALLWTAERSSAVQLAQLLLSETSDAAAAFTEMHIDAFAELLRQVAGHAATAWKGETGGETELIYLNAMPAETEPGQSSTMTFADDKLSEVSLRLSSMPSFAKSWSLGKKRLTLRRLSPSRRRKVRPSLRLPPPRPLPLPKRLRLVLLPAPRHLPLPRLLTSTCSSTLS